MGLDTALRFSEAGVPTITHPPAITGADEPVIPQGIEQALPSQFAVHAPVLPDVPFPPSAFKRFLDAGSRRLSASR